MDELFPYEPSHDRQLVNRAAQDPEAPPSPCWRTRFLFWLFVWGGTTLSGGALGLTIGVPAMFFVGGGFDVVGWAILFGAIWAGVAGVFVMGHVATFKWMFGIESDPKLIAGIAGGLTGLTAFYLFFVTVPCGIVGGIAGARLFLKTERGREVVRFEAWRLDPTIKKPRRHFTIKDLMLRMTAICVLLAVYMFVWNN